MQTNELKAEIARKGMNIGGLAERTGLPRTTLWRRMKHPNEFTIKEITKIQNALDLDGQKVIDIFFTSGVS